MRQLLKQVVNDSSGIITTGWVNVNTGCNNRCRWCYKTDELGDEPLEMKFEMANHVVDFFSGLSLYSCIFIGGEPTLYEGLVPLVEKTKIGGIEEVTVVTNGRLLGKNDLSKRLSDAGLDVFSVSIHSAEEALHNSIARRDSWRETVAGIESVVSLGAKCSLNLVVGQQNYESVIPSIQPLLNLGVDQIIVSCAIPCVIDGSVDGSNSLDPRLFGELVGQIAECPDQVVVLHELPLCLIEREAFMKLAMKNRLGYGCHVGVGRGLSIDTEGRVIPCNSFPSFPMFRLFDQDGPLYSIDEFLAHWTSNTDVQELRAEANVYRSEICKECDLWPLCNCGCPLTWGFYEPEGFINGSLVDVEAETVYGWTRAHYNP